MPELPEVETVCRSLRGRLEGRRLKSVDVRRRKLRLPLPPDFAARVAGRRVVTVARRGKYILMPLDDKVAIIAHLGMSGRMTLTEGPPPVPGPHDHVIFETDDGASLVFNDARRFGLMTLADVDGIDAHPLFRGMGPEPLADAFDGRLLGQALDSRNTAVKTALMDQRVVAGIGNIYACEALFRAGISPRRKAKNLGGARCRGLAAALKRVLTEAIEAGGSSLRDYRRPSGELGTFQHRFAVYGREGEACPGCCCDLRETGGIRRILQGGRATFFCPSRQR